MSGLKSEARLREKVAVQPVRVEREGEGEAVAMHEGEEKSSSFFFS
jgi:hypothetical protein